MSQKKSKPKAPPKQKTSTAIVPIMSDNLKHAVTLLDDTKQFAKFLRDLGKSDKPALNALLDEHKKPKLLTPKQKEQFTEGMRAYAEELQKKAMVTLEGPPVNTGDPDRDQWVESQRADIKAKKKHPVQFTKKGGEITIVAPDGITASVESMSNTGQVEYNAASIVLTQITRAQPWRDNADMCTGMAGMLAGLDPQDPLEGLLCAQMTMAHNLASEFARRAITSENADAVDKNIGRATKLMNTFTRQMEALQKHRTKGQQQIIVKHQQVQQVNVGPGGQAIVGDVNQGGGGRG